MSGLSNYLVRDLKYTELKAMKAEYQIKLFIRLCINCTLLGIIMAFLGFLYEYAILLVAYKLYRSAALGIHLKGKIACFIASFIVLAIPILLYQSIHMYWLLELILWLIILSICIIYIPQGSSSRPLRSKELKKKLKFQFGIYLMLTMAFRFINSDIYNLSLWALLLTALLTTPIAYLVFGVKHDRCV